MSSKLAALGVQILPHGVKVPDIPAEHSIQSAAPTE